MELQTSWSLRRGAALQADGSVRFSVWAPRAANLSVHLAAGGPHHLMEPGGDGVYETVVPGWGDGIDYFYCVDGHDRPDPVSRHQPRGVHGPSRVVDPRAFAWSDGSWRGREVEDLVVYELHAGTFSAAGTFEGVVDHLERLRALGVTAIELMPVAEFPGGRNWGYDGVHPYAPQSTYGGPLGLRRLVDAAHGADLAVLLDVVYNHLGPEGNYLTEFGPYFTDRYATPWGPAINFDGAESDEVRRYFIDNALYWLTEYHLDGLRLDAVHAIFDFGARHFLQELAAAVHEQGRRLGRTLLAIAESDLNDPRLARDCERGGYGLDAQWSDDFHHAVHTVLTGERTGYYADFGDVDAIAKAERDRFVYDGRRSAHRRRRHGAPAGDVPAQRFVVFVQNHDQIGNRAHGERLAALVPLERRKLAAALLLVSPYVPLLFMGEEYGETNPFLYFVSHGDADLVCAVREGRRREFAAFTWGEEVPDPQAENTFERSRLDHGKATSGEHAALRKLYADLLELRAAEPALRPGRAAVDVGGEPSAGWFVLKLSSRQDGRLAALFNCSPARCLAGFADAEERKWVLRVATDAEEYGGAGAAAAASLGGRHPETTLSPWAAAVYREERD